MTQELSLPRSLGALTAVLFLAGTGAAQQEETDTLILTNGATETGKVLEESWSGLSFQPERGAKKVVPWDTIQTVDYFDAPEELQSGIAVLAAGNMEAAKDQFELVLGLTENRPMIVQQARFHLAYAEQRMGKTSEAAAAYTKLLQDFPKSRYLREAAENLLTLRLEANDAAGAQSVLDSVAQGAKGVEGIEPLIGLLEARLLEGQGKIAPLDKDGKPVDNAGQRFAAVEAMAGAPANLVQEAKLGRARILLLNNKAAEAEPIFRALITESPLPRVQSGAWNGLGELQAADGRAKKNSERILEALYAYLRSVVQYKPLPGESTEEYERALAGAATCFKLLSELEQNPEKKKLHRERERERWEQLQLEYPSSSFLKKK
jgi:tetratricopeptide (TPR) repeat protein